MFFVNEFLKDDIKFEQLLNRVKINGANRRLETPREYKSEEDETSSAGLIEPDQVPLNKAFKSQKYIPMNYEDSSETSNDVSSKKFAKSDFDETEEN